MIITVDGPAGAGKSTVCRLLAQELGFTYLDTGAMYRALAWAWLHRSSRESHLGHGDVDTSRAECESPCDAEFIRTLPLRFTIQNGSMIILYREEPLGDEIRVPLITQCSSRLSRIAVVRNFLTDCQRRLAQKGDLVAEGRDMGSVVFPNAEVKVYLTASLQARTRRRFNEYQQKGVAIEYAALEAEIRERDERDAARELAPMKPASDAVFVDTSELTIPEVVSLLKRLALGARW